MTVILNPWTKVDVSFDFSAVTQADLDSFAELMDSDLRETLNSDLLDPTPGEFLEEWAKRVGPEEAGRVIIGS